MENYELITVNWIQIALAVFASIIVYTTKYNIISDKYEKANNKPYNILTYLKNNVGNIINSIFCAILILFIVNELGIEILIKNVAGFDFIDAEEKTTDITAAILSGLFGSPIVKKLVKLRINKKELEIENENKE